MFMGGGGMQNIIPLYTAGVQAALIRAVETRGFSMLYRVFWAQF